AKQRQSRKDSFRAPRSASMPVQQALIEDRPPPGFRQTAAERKHPPESGESAYLLDALGNIAVIDFGVEPSPNQRLTDLVRNHDRAVMPACAAECDRQIALALADVMRKEIDEQLGNALNKFPGLRERTNISGHAGVTARQLLKSRYVVGVGQKTDVKDKIAVGRNAVTISEARHVDHDLGLFTIPAEFFADELAQFMHREFRGVDDKIRHRAYWSQCPTLRLNTFGDSPIGAERVRPARFAEPAQDRLVVCIQK